MFTKCELMQAVVEEPMKKFTAADGDDGKRARAKRFTALPFAGVISPKASDFLQDADELVFIT